MKTVFRIFLTVLFSAPFWLSAQIGLPPEPQKNKEGKVDEQTQMMNAIREKNEIKERRAAQEATGEAPSKTPPPPPKAPAVHVATKRPTNLGERPKLVVGITVDQMRMDYLYRFWDAFGDGGFKRIVERGFVCGDTISAMHRPIRDPDMPPSSPAPLRGTTASLATTGTIGTATLRFIAHPMKACKPWASTTQQTRADTCRRIAWKPPRSAMS